MISSIDAFLRWFDSVNRRAIRDVSALPPDAASWRPGEDNGEGSWSVGALVAHMAEARSYFASAFSEQGWIWEPWTPEEGEDLTGTLQRSFDEMAERLRGSPDGWLNRKVALLGGQGEISGWRTLMMMAEHDVHHRSQIDTYAGINGWKVEHIFGLAAEEVAARQPAERQRFGL